MGANDINDNRLTDRGDLLAVGLDGDSVTRLSDLADSRLLNRLTFGNIESEGPWVADGLRSLGTDVEGGLELVVLCAVNKVGNLSVGWLGLGNALIGRSSSQSLGFGWGGAASLRAATAVVAVNRATIGTSRANQAAGACLKHPFAVVADSDLITSASISRGTRSTGSWAAGATGSSSWGARRSGSSGGRGTRRFGGRGRSTAWRAGAAASAWALAVMKIAWDSCGIIGGAIGVGISLASIPHHDTTKRLVLRLEAVNSASQSGIRNISRVGSSGRSGNTKEDFDVGVLGLSLGPVIPGIKVEVTTLNRAIVVVELNPDEVEPGIVQGITKVGVREWALRCTSDIVALGRVRS